MQSEFPCSVAPTLAGTMTCFSPSTTPLLLLSAPERLSGGKAEIGERGIRMFMLLVVSSPITPGLARVFLPSHLQLLRPGLVEGIPLLVLLLLRGCFPLSGVGEKRFQPLVAAGLVCLCHIATPQPGSSSWYLVLPGPALIMG